MLIRGALIGLLLLLLNPLAGLLVTILAIFGWYPWWLVTTDDPHSPFGQYEETVRETYTRFGRWAGDVYWLAFRNCLYGLAYWFKPEAFKGVTDYSHLHLWSNVGPRSTFYSAAGYEQLTIELGPWFVLMLGWKVDNVVLDPDTPRQRVNMDFRPIFSIRKAK